MMGEDPAKDEGLRSNFSVKVHRPMCLELKSFVDRISQIYPAIESARPRCTSGVLNLCSLGFNMDKSELIIQHCATSSKLYLAITAKKILFQCEKIQKALDLCLGQIQNLVPTMLAAKISGIIEDLRNAMFHLESSEDEAGKAVLALIRRRIPASSDCFENSELEALRLASSSLKITSWMAISEERSCIKRLLVKVHQTDPKKERILKHLLNLLREYGELIHQDQTINNLPVHKDQKWLQEQRKGIEMAGSNIERFWNHVEQTNDHGILKCKFCGHLFAEDTSLSRIKWHLLGEHGHGVAICGQVPEQVQEAAFLAMHGGNSTHKTMRQRRKRIEMAPLKSGLIGAVSASAREHNNVDMAQQREPLLTGEFEQANDLTGAGIELPRDAPDDQDELKKLEGSKSRDMVDDFKSGLTGAVSASAQEQNNVDMAQQQEPLLTGEFEQAIDLTGGGIELPRDAPDDQDELKKLEGSKSRDMVDFLKSGWTLLLTNLILEITSVFDQLGYALVGMVLAFVALLLATAELIHMARKERMSLLPSFHRPSTSTLAPGKPVGTIVEYFGLVGAVWQCIYSTVEYAYDRQKMDNPIKTCLLPSIFLLCVVISKLKKKSRIDKSA